MNKNDKLGIWAGFPWFDNSWGRDTFIALSGISLTQGLYKEAREIIRNFFLMQNRDELIQQIMVKSQMWYLVKRIPNIIPVMEHPY
jgi:glycogen debranching enzyme